MNGPETTLAGQMLGGYHLLAPLGRGGMGIVYKAHQPSLDRYVAVKVLPAILSHDPTFAARFEREAKAVARLEHPHILPIYDYGQEGGISYIVMRYVEGGTLRDVLGEPLAPVTAAGIVEQIAEALDYAHQQGVVHRDVKPANVLMDRGRWALLSDFGVARMIEATTVLTGTGVGIGTPTYMSPEQGQGLAVDGRSDVYSLGVVLYEMLTGRVPFQAETPMGVVVKHIAAPLPRPREVNPRIPKAVERVLLKALAKDPAGRFPTAGELADTLRKATEGMDVLPKLERPPVAEEEARPVAPATARPKAIPKEARKPRLSPLLLVVVGVLALMLVVAVGLVLSEAEGLGALVAGRAGRGTATPAVKPKGAAAASPTVTLRPTVPPLLTTTATPADRIIYSVSEGNSESLYATDLAGGEPHLLASGADSFDGSRLSPDGQRVIVRLARGDKASLYLMKADGSDRQVLASDQDYVWATFSEDGQKIRARWRTGDFHDLAMMDADGSNPVSPLSRASNLSYSWAGDWQKVAMSVKEGDEYALYVANTDGSERKTIARGGSSSYSPRLSDDSQRLLYRTREGDAYDLYLANADGSQPTKLAAGVSSLGSQRFSPSGKKLLFSLEETSDGSRDLYVVDTASGQRLRLVSGEYVWGSFSPDGQWAWAHADREGMEHLYVISADGAQQQEVVGPVEDVGWPAFSPDEQWAVVDVQRDGLYHLYLVSADGTQQREIVGAGEGADWYADGYFSPDGQRVLVRLGHKDPCCRSSLYVVSADGSQRTELAGDADWQLAAAFTADGQHIVFDSDRDGGQAIYVADADGRNVRKLAEGYRPLVASGRPARMLSHPKPRPTPTPSP